MLGSQRAARHQERGHLRVEPQRLGTVDAGALSPLGGGALRHQGGDGRTQGQPGDLGTSLGGLETGGGKGQCDRVSPGRPQPVGQTRAGVLLVDDDWHACLSGGEVGGGGDVAAEADDDVGLDRLDGLGGCADRLAQPVWQAQQVPTGRRGRGTRGTRASSKPASGTRRFSSPSAVPRTRIRVPGSPPRAGSCRAAAVASSGFDVAGGTATGQQHPQRLGALGLCPLGRACALTCLGHGSSLGR